MEITLLLVLMGSSVAFTLLSFILKDVIALRLISGMLLVGFSLSVLLPVMWVGFTSTGVSTYVTSTAGDPGRLGEVEILSLGFGLVGVFQILYGLILMVKLAFTQTNPDNYALNPDAEAYI
jgi:hypothetical protein